MKLRIEVKKLMREYLRKGDKVNRRQQYNRMIAFAKTAELMGANSMGQVGNRHVIQYWKENRGLQEGTAYNHWLAICKLWERANKQGLPPKYLPYSEI